ncbi:MAG: 16S rRNA (cytosine(1402)-N(4))-methyltransferase RsmH [Mycoplasmataceae bacterium]|nr:16S rRNA (cytosine(1402)-N(4))-methyltransferase RsmH [Mycoplasmataceae bacterium]
MNIINNLHAPVLLRETMNLMNIKADGVYVDSTAGRGGHSQAIINFLSKKGLLLCIDTDNEAISYLHNKFTGLNNVKIIKGNFANISMILKTLNIKKVDGILADLGVSSPMFDDTTRGFSYHNDGVLDMRMDQNQTKTASDVINNYSKHELISMFKKYGDVNHPNIVVDKIINERKTHVISSTSELVKIIKSVLPKKELTKLKHPAKVYFQALRIEVNDEINKLKDFLNQVPNLLNKGGKLLIISFHSLEDKIVKDYFNLLISSNIPKEVPLIFKPDFTLLNKKPIVPAEQEILSNFRSRSAKLRGVMKNV